MRRPVRLSIYLQLAYFARRLVVLYLIKASPPWAVTDLLLHFHNSNMNMVMNANGVTASQEGKKAHGVDVVQTAANKWRKVNNCNTKKSTDRALQAGKRFPFALKSRVCCDTDQPGGVGEVGKMGEGVVGRIRATHHLLVLTLCLFLLNEQQKIQGQSRTQYIKSKERWAKIPFNPNHHVSKKEKRNEAPHFFRGGHKRLMCMCVVFGPGPGSCCCCGFLPSCLPRQRNAKAMSQS